MQGFRPCFYVGGGLNMVMFTHEHQVAFKDDLLLTNDLLKNVKWSKLTYIGGKSQQNDARLCTNWIKIDPDSVIEVQFNPSVEQTDWDFLGKYDLNDNNWNSDDGWNHNSNTIWRPDIDRNGSSRKPLNYVAIVLNNPGKADKVTCSFKVIQKINVVDYIKKNFDKLKSYLGGSAPLSH